MDNEIYSVLNQKPSAYRSMKMAQLGLTTNKKNKGDLKRWRDEKWINLTAFYIDDDDYLPCGKKSQKQLKKGLPSVCRPSIKINEKTTKPLVKELTKQQIKKAIEIKKLGKQIKWDNL